MKRCAFMMKLKAECIDIYTKRHDEIWPELEKELQAAGILNYSISFEKETHLLFATQELSDDNTADGLPQTDIVKKWWGFMSDIMVTEDDGFTPWVKSLDEVYYMKA